MQCTENAVELIASPSDSCSESVHNKMIKHDWILKLIGVKTMVCSQTNSSVGLSKKKKEKKKKDGEVRPVSVYNSNGVFLATCECFWVRNHHDLIPKRHKSSTFGHMQAFPMYGSLSMSVSSVPSLHTCRESNNSLICRIHMEQFS